MVQIINCISWLAYELFMKIVAAAWSASTLQTMLKLSGFFS